MAKVTMISHGCKVTRVAGKGTKYTETMRLVDAREEKAWEITLLKGNLPLSTHATQILVKYLKEGITGLKEQYGEDCKEVGYAR